MEVEKSSILAKIAAFFTVSGMLKGKQTIGQVPATKNAYTIFFKVAWPSAIESLLVGLVGSVDTMMVGTLGEGAIAAVGITNQPKFILLALIFSLNTGVTAVVARRKGQNDQEGANRVLRVCILISALIAMAASAIGAIFAKPILVFAGAQPDYLADAETYFRILAISLFFTALNLTINAAQRGVGKTKISMRTNVIANLVNLLFNYLLINGIGFFPRLEVAGAAIATCLGAIAACAISFVTLLQKNGYLSFFYNASWRATSGVVSPVFKVASSAFVEQVFMRIGFFLYAVIIARLGTTPYATHLICMNILSLSFCFGDGFGVAATALVGQNLGAKRPDLSMLYGKVGQRIAFVVSSVMFFVFIFGRNVLIALFSKEPEIIALGAQVMIIVAFSTHAQTSQVVLSGCLRGAGDTKFVAIVSVISVAILRPFLTWLLCFPAGLGLIGAWLTLVIDQCLRFIFSYTRFNSGKWQKIAL